MHNGDVEQSQPQWLVEFLKKVGTLPLVLNKDQAAEQLNIGRTYLDRLIASGQIRVIYYEPNGHPRILLEEVIRFLKEKDEESKRLAPARQPAKKSPRTFKAAMSDVESDVAQFRAGLKKQRRH